MQKKKGLTGFGARLRLLREERKITQQGMTDRINEYFINKGEGPVFSKLQAYNRYEIYNAQPSVDMLKAFSSVLGVSADYLIDNSFYVKKQQQDDLKTIGKNIKKLREAKGLKQWHMAFFLQTSSAMYSDIERGNRAVSVERLKKIAYHLQCDPKSLFAGSTLALSDLPQTEPLDSVGCLDDLEKCEIKVDEVIRPDGNPEYVLQYAGRDAESNSSVQLSYDQLYGLYGESMTEAEEAFRPLMLKYFRELFLRRAVQVGVVQEKGSEQ